MSSAPRCSVVLHLCVLFTTVSAYYVSTIIQCETEGSPGDVSFSSSVMYNQQDFLSYNSSRLRFDGYGDFGLKWAKDLNRDPAVLKIETEKVLEQCRLYSRNLLPALNRTVKPRVVLKLLSSGMLMCSAYEFFPKLIKVTWLRDGEPVEADVISTEELSDGHWFYQIHSGLEHRPKPGEKISCKVEHRSLTQPIIYTWDSSLPVGERFRIVVGVAALLVGFITALYGLIYYYIKTPGWTSVHNIESF